MIDDRNAEGQDNEAEDELEVGDEDRLPWLEAVEEEDGGGDGPSVAKLIAAIVIGLVAIGVIVGGLFWLGNGDKAGGNGELIAAPEGDYKARPDNPGGANFAGEGDVAAAASAGQTPQGNLNVNAVAEPPVTPGQPAPAPQPPAPAPVPAPPRPAPAPQPAASGPTIQLGAFSSQASANQAWSALSGRFRYLAPLSHNVVSAQVGGRTLYRLRASGADAAGICRRLQAAGEACSVVS
ncbi:MAG: hypothetical protein QOJ53_1508 [Sphingomonadales bacterium]|jgi:hypothetical protein|nr:hypothetical protein [Sphingomonadales bacterium]MEA3045574.1 hypothetical protein [Sphingomonadales bacterium]MEA3047176.1 hypothetical protein [Sphingomonadales bacterium]